MSLLDSVKVGKPLPLDADYHARVQCMDFWRLSYIGGPAYKDGKDCSGEDVFVPHEHESKAGKDRRKRLSTYKNYVKQVVNKYSAFIFSSVIVREEGNDSFSEFSDDVDMLGTTLNEFMRHQMTWALVEGRRYCLVDSTSVDPATTVAQQEEQGDRIFLVDVDPRRVTTTLREGHRLSEAIVLMEPDHYRFYDADDFADIFMFKNKVKAVSGRISHGFGMLPLVETLPSSEHCSFVQDIAELNKSIFNLDAVLKEEINRQTFSQYIATGLATEDFKSTELGGRRIITVDKSGKDVTFTRLAADVQQAASIREAMQSDVDEIYRLAGLTTPAAITQAESGRALKLRWDEVARIAADLADQAESAENQMIGLWMAGMDDDDVEFSDYPEEFNSEDLSTELANALSVLNGPFSQALKDKAQERIAQRMFPELKPEERQKLMGGAPEQDQTV